jgi:acetyl-CoA synthetase (ADP-forming)
MKPRENFLKHFQAATSEGRTVLQEDAATEVCRSYGIPTPESGFAPDGQAAVVVAERLGYPVVIKLISPQVSHKSDVGGVRLNVRSAAEAREACEAIVKSVKGYVPQAEIRGFWVAKMVGKGVETIVGLKRDPVFGPVAMFGVGGVFVEIYRDVSFGVCPLREDDIEDMLAAIQGRRLLEGFRGMPQANIEALKKILRAVCQLGMENPEIESVDFNPVWADPESALALDARIIIQRAGSPRP